MLHFKRNILFICLSVLFCQASLGQENDLNNFKYLQSSGIIPDDFTTLFSEKFKKDKELLSKDEKSADRKTKEEFLQESNFSIDRILLSGRILFNDPVSKYINKVADILLAENPKLRKELRFYVAKSPSVNAFSTDNGIIIVNVGLIAQLENEAQLAYCLAHEITHYVKKHNLNIFLEKKKIFSGKDSYNKLSLSEAYLASNFRSREMEAEADKLGLNEVYLPSKYSLKALDRVFDVMQYSYLPFDEVPFDTTFFDTPYMHLPSKCFLKEISPIKGDENYDEKKSIHPSIKSRRLVLQQLTSELSNENRVDFILPKEDFLKAKSLAQFEAIHQMIVLRDYGNAMYNSYFLLKEFPENKFLQTSIAYCLYALSEYKFKSTLKNVLTPYKTIEGQSQQLFYLLNTLKKEELSAISLHYIWKVHQKFPTDDFLTQLYKKSFVNLVVKCQKSISDYSKKAKEELKQDIEKQKVDTIAKSKYDKIKKVKANEDLKDENFISYVFVDAFKDAEFFDQFSQANDKQKDIIAEKIVSNIVGKKTKTIKEQGVDTVLLMDPFYYTIDVRGKEDKMLYLEAEKSTFALVDKLNFYSKILKLNLEFLNPRNCKSDEIQSFNDYSRVYEWMEERFNHDEKEIIPFETRNCKDVLVKYNTKHIGWTGIVNLRERNHGVGWYVFFSIIAPISIPYMVPMMFVPSYSTNYYFFLFNAETGEIKLEVSNNLHTNSRTDFVNSWIYKTMNQIKHLEN